jgi:hypothetical protein
MCHHFGYDAHSKSTSQTGERIMLSAIVKACKPIIHHVKETIKNFTKPETAVLAAGTVSDITRSRKDLIAENAILRQQLLVLKRQVKRFLAVFCYIQALLHAFPVFNRHNFPL